MVAVPPQQLPYFDNDYLPGVFPQPLALHHLIDYDLIYRIMQGNWEWMGDKATRTATTDGACLPAAISAYNNKIFFCHVE